MRTLQKLHGQVASGHELNVHGFPDARGVCIPRNITVCAFIVDSTGAGGRRARVGAYKRGAGSESSEEDRCEHFGEKRRRAVGDEGRGVAVNVTGQPKTRRNAIVRILKVGEDRHREQRRSTKRVTGWKEWTVLTL